MTSTVRRNGELVRTDHRDIVAGLADYGAAGDGTTDDTAAVQAAIDATGTGTGIRGGTIDCGPGTFRLTDTVTIDRRSIRMVGRGWTNPTNLSNRGGGTAFVWDGPSDRPMFLVTDSFGVEFAWMRLQGNDTTPATAAVEFRGTTGATGTNGHLRVVNCHIGSWPWGGQGAGFTVGLLWDGTNQNNDEWHVGGCVIKDCTTGLKVAQSQSVWGRIEDSTITDATLGLSLNADATLHNVRFNSCDLDWEVLGTSSVWFYGYFTEGASKFGEMSEYAKVRLLGGDVNVNALGGSMLSTPSGALSGFRLVVRDVDFDRGPTAATLDVTISAAPATAPALSIEDSPGLTTSNLSVNAGVNFVWRDGALTSTDPTVAPA